MTCPFSLYCALLPTYECYVFFIAAQSLIRRHLKRSLKLNLTLDLILDLTHQIFIHIFIQPSKFQPVFCSDLVTQQLVCLLDYFPV